MVRDHMPATLDMISFRTPRASVRAAVDVAVVDDVDLQQATVLPLKAKVSIARSTECSDTDDCQHLRI